MIKKNIYLLALLLLIGISCGNPSTVTQRDGKSALVINNGDLDNIAITAILKEIGDSERITLTTTDSLEILGEGALFDYSTIIFNQTDINKLSIRQRSNIQQYIQSGGGIVAMNTAMPLPYFWHWYIELLKQNKATNTDLFQQLEYDGGRFAMANDSTLFNNVDLKKALTENINFAIGENSYDVGLITALQAPYEHNFTSITLDNDLNEPMGMAILPDGKVIMTERRGKVKLYDPFEKATSTIANFDVCTEGNYEDGLMGIALDPKYGTDNHYLYMYYSPPCQETNQYLSRFVFKDDSIHQATEKVVLKVKVQRETCCHSGGAVVFGPKGMIYLSTGDNTSSKESDGASPLDERKDRSPFDAQKSSGNTHDLRGKIIRIIPKENGTYDIPEGNLFPKDGSKGRPEIYAMGARNPFRIAVDANGYVYWGDVGPDGGTTTKYGPESYDEWNQAKTAGNYGWPYFAGDNFAYNHRDFATDEVGEPYDPKKPMNESVYNTGAKELPPARTPMIWYPYGKSEEFPLLGTGSRSAMAGPFYYSQPSHKKFSKLPDYYNGKMFIYEWARSWVQVLTFDDDMNLVQMEDFLPNTDFAKPIDMQIGADGSLYFLEYGHSYFLNNPKAKLRRVAFSEINKAPIAAISADKINGASPLTVAFSADGSYDYDAKEALKYEWFFTGDAAQSEEKNATHTFEENGIYNVKVKVTDEQGASGFATVKVAVGNEPPSISLEWQGNQSFYFGAAATLPYKVIISDQEDESNEGIEYGDASVDVSYISDSDYLNDLVKGKKEVPTEALSYLEGKKLINESDCRSCHHEENKSIGPNYKEVATKYADDYDAVLVLANKVIKGGSGIWGKNVMAAHPDLTKEDAREMVKYIMSLGKVSSMPAEGSMNLKDHATRSTKGGYILTASYKDKGANNIEPITGRSVYYLRDPKLEAEHFDERSGGWVSRFGKGLVNTQVSVGGKGFLKFNGIDLTGISKVGVNAQGVNGGTIVIRKNAPDGQKIGSVSIGKGDKDTAWKEVMTRISGSGQHDLYITFESTKTVCNLDWIRFYQ